MARTKGRSRVSVSVDVSGPFFDPVLTAHVIDGWLDDSVDDLAQQGYDELQRRFQKKFRQKTGAYEGRVTVNRAADDRVITDNFVVYGAWLEGTSQRNRSTKWKGYSNFRLTRLWLRRKNKDVAQAKLDKALAQIR